MISNIFLGTAGLLILLAVLVVSIPVAIALLGVVVSNPFFAIGLVGLIVAIGKFIKQV